MVISCPATTFAAYSYWDRASESAGNFAVGWEIKPETREQNNIGNKQILDFGGKG